ncbi:MAG: hypothetical protein K6U03_08760 [Firmicutes bacterium]|nr:hypothetical protein [Bacillota bacterium]
MALVTVLTADVIASRARGDVGPFLAERLARLEHPALLTPATNEQVLLNHEGHEVTRRNLRDSSCSSW